jgi:hypothetical protein
MINNLAHLTFRDHAVHISQDTQGDIHCFKYDDSACDFEIFDNQDAASDYILSPLPRITYRVVFTGEEP